MHILPLNTGTLPPEGVGAGMKLPERSMQSSQASQDAAIQRQKTPVSELLFFTALRSGWQRFPEVHVRGRTRSSTLMFIVPCFEWGLP